MTQLCTIAIQSSREVTQPRENEGLVKPPFFCLLRVTEFGSSPALMQAKRRVAAAAAFFRVSGNRVSFGPSDLVCARFQSGSILDKLLFVPRPPPSTPRGAFAVLVCLSLPFVHQVMSGPFVTVRKAPEYESPTEIGLST